jgi:hypothetical protein
LWLADVWVIWILLFTNKNRPPVWGAVKNARVQPGSANWHDHLPNKDAEWPAGVDDVHESISESRRYRLSEMLSTFICGHPRDEIDF